MKKFKKIAITIMNSIGFILGILLSSSWIYEKRYLGEKITVPVTLLIVVIVFYTGVLFINIKDSRESKKSEENKVGD